MIRDNEIDAHLDFLRDTSEDLGKQRGRMLYCESNLRRVKSLQMLIAPAGSQTSKEAYAYGTNEYRRAMEEHENAVAAYETCRALREHAIYCIEVWRSQNSNRRQGIVT